MKESYVQGAEKRRAQCLLNAAAAAPSCPSATRTTSPTCLATLTHVLIYIFVNIYLHTCMIVHICYGIFAFLYLCANIFKGCRVAERWGDVACHI